MIWPVNIWNTKKVDAQHLLNTHHFKHTYVTTLEDHINALWKCVKI